MERGLEKGVEKAGKVGKITEVKKFLIAGVLAAMGCGQAGAQFFYETVAGNVGATVDGSSPFALGNSFAQQFTTGTLNPGDADQDGRVWHLFTVQLQPGYVFDPDGGDGGDFVAAETIYEWSLLSSSGGEPGSAVVGPRQFSIPAAGFHQFSYGALVSAEEFVLQSNTSYWLTIRFAYLLGVVSPSMPVLLPLTNSEVQDGPGTLGGLLVSGDGWGGVLGRMVVQVQVESVPEPGSAGLVALGLGCWLARRRRCRR
jgi:hypothetical protein